MLRTPALLLLLTLGIPFVRAPLCGAGSHEHAEQSEHAPDPTPDPTPGHAHGTDHAPTPPPAESPDFDCHTLMRCNVPADVGVVVVALGAAAEPTPGEPTRPPLAHLGELGLSPELPPPRTI